MAPAAKVTIGTTANPTPTLVATPFPPRHPKKTLKLLPITVANPANTKAHSLTPKRSAMRIASIAFKGSAKTTATAGHRPTERKTLVAPMLPEPTFWISTP